MTELTNQEKLEEVYKLTLENNQILHGIRSRERVANAFRILYWIIIVGSLAGAYVYIRPIISLVMSNQAKINQTLDQFNTLRGELPNANMFGNFLENLKNQFKTSASTTEGN